MNLTGCAAFDEFCAIRRAPSIPAAPSMIAAFIAANAGRGIDWLWQSVGDISRAHYMLGLADPTLGAPVGLAFNAVAAIEPPQSWPKAFKVGFHALPYNLQAYLASRDREVSREIKRAQNEAAEARKTLEKLQRQTKVNNGATVKESAAA